MKKILSLLLALVLAFSFAGCVAPAVVPETTVADTTQPATIHIEFVTFVKETEPPTTEADQLPPQTDPPATRPEQTEPESSLPLQTDPPYFEQETYEEETQPEQTEPAATQPPETLPPQTDPPQTDPPQTDPPQQYLDPDGTYTSRDDVALFIYLYGRLPNNFITKRQADDRYGTTSVSRYGLCIGGDRFYNKEKLLPQQYTYYECDIDTLYGGGRGKKRLVFTYSGLIYYTSDHYESFTLLYGNP